MADKAISIQKKEYEDKYRGLVGKMEGALVEIRKAKCILDHWTQEYGFSEKPDPKAAIEWGNNLNGDTHGMQSHKWVYDYKTIYQMIDIVTDYVYAVNSLIEESIY